VWQPRPADPELEAEMLRRLMVRLGVEETRAKTMMAAEQRQDRAKLSRATDGAGALLLEEAFDRAWRRVGLALDRVGFTVEDRDRSQGLYFVRYVDPDVDNKKKDDDKGFHFQVDVLERAGPRQADSGSISHSGQDGPAIQPRSRCSPAKGALTGRILRRRILGLLYDQLK
jgi:outer membrane protein assembly factor BamC